MPFRVGQRWISDTESELGLGTIVAVDVRTVTLFFHASGENRLYSRHEAPLTRVRFSVGDILTSHEGWQINVNQVEVLDDLLYYTGSKIDDPLCGTTLCETLLDHHLTFSKPQERLFTGQIDRSDRFALRYHAHVYQSEQLRLSYSGLGGIRADLIPHQLYIAHEVAHRYAPRVLLADEVGLGKTIEAGMIIHHQLLSGRIERVLIIVPPSLQHQWLVEMLRRFNLSFSLFDRDRYLAALQDSDNPFDTEQLVICSTDFLLADAKHQHHLLNATWDLLVVDEAHHLQWSNEFVSPAYRAIEALSSHIPAILLLTATPEQLGQQSHFARLRLLDKHRFHDYNTFIQEQQRYQPIAEVVNSLLQNTAFTPNEMHTLCQLIPEQDLSPFFESITLANGAQTDARCTLINLLMDRHGTSRVLFRNTREHVKGFPKRVLEPIKLPLPEHYRSAIQQYTDNLQGIHIDERARKMRYPEQIYQTMRAENGVEWWNIDPRVSWLLHYLLTHREEKAVIICAHATIAQQLEKYIREREGIRAALFHEGLSLLERDKAAAYFATPTDSGAQALICSEIGSEGRNFQFAHTLIMFDLPCDPDLLEQRIGRLDRIGQQQEIHIIVPYLENTAQAHLLRWFHEGLNAFEKTCTLGSTLYTQVVSELNHFLAMPDNAADFDKFIQNSRIQADQLRQQLTQGRDRLLELHSHGGEKGKALAEILTKQDNDLNLVRFALQLFDTLGIHQEDQDDNFTFIAPSETMLIPDFPGIPADGCTITFNRQQALSREDAQFISWEHPIIRNGLDLLTSGNTGNCAVALLKNKALPAGMQLLELIYIVETQAPKNLHLNRFLPPTPIRVLMDKRGNNLADQVSFEHLHQQLTHIKRHMAYKIVNAAREELQLMLDRAEQAIIPQARALITEATQQAESHMQAELTRLRALKTVNPTIRDEELSLLQQASSDIAHHLAQANWRLDALRLMVVIQE